MASASSNIALSEEHIGSAERHVIRQKEIVAELRRDGHSTKMAEDLLRLFEQTLAMHIQHRDLVNAQVEHTALVGSTTSDAD